MAFSTQNGRCLVAFCGRDFGPTLALSLHLLSHGFIEVCGGRQVFDFNPHNFDTPGIGGGINGLQQPRIDGIALR